MLLLAFLSCFLLGCLDGDHQSNWDLQQLQWQQELQGLNSIPTFPVHPMAIARCFQTEG